MLLGDLLEIGSKIVSHAAYMGHWVEPLETQVAALGDCRILGDSSGCQLLETSCGRVDLAVQESLIV